MKNHLYALTLGLAAFAFQGCFDASTAPRENASTDAIAAMVALPDVMFTARQLLSATPSQASYSYTIKNVGTATIPDLFNVVIQNFYSDNPLFNDAGDVFLGNVPIGVHVALPPGASHSGTVTLNAVMRPNVRFLLLKIDGLNTVMESNESNNVAYTLVRPDLGFSNVTVISHTATQVDYSYTIRNTGTVTLPDMFNVTIQNFYSANNVFNDSGDAPAGGGIVGVHGSLAPGASFSGVFSAIGTVPAGMTFLTGKIDASNAIIEVSETNNTFAAAIP
jgi:subtilase family serine protease